ncbi:hypothetical protein BDF19DRAFT_56666 [Syncephalis fuscata]|nr:hypothetical protein BDF19DRAFT_56666 [Syncephalis fuscata]
MSPPIRQGISPQPSPQSQASASQRWPGVSGGPQPPTSASSTSANQPGNNNSGGHRYMDSHGSTSVHTNPNSSMLGGANNNDLQDPVMLRSRQDTFGHEAELSDVLRNVNDSNRSDTVERRDSQGQTDYHNGNQQQQQYNNHQPSPPHSGQHTPGMNSSRSYERHDTSIHQSDTEMNVDTMNDRSDYNNYNQHNINNNTNNNSTRYNRQRADSQSSITKGHVTTMDSVHSVPSTPHEPQPPSSSSSSTHRRPAPSSLGSNQDRWNDQQQQHTSNTDVQDDVDRYQQQQRNNKPSPRQPNPPYSIGSNSSNSNSNHGQYQRTSPSHERTGSQSARHIDLDTGLELPEPIPRIELDHVENYDQYDQGSVMDGSELSEEDHDDEQDQRAVHSNNDGQHRSYYDDTLDPETPTSASLRSPVSPSYRKRESILSHRKEKRTSRIGMNQGGTTNPYSQQHNNGSSGAIGGGKMARRRSKRLSTHRQSTGPSLTMIVDKLRTKRQEIESRYQQDSPDDTNRDHGFNQRLLHYRSDSNGNNRSHDDGLRAPVDWPVVHWLV